MASPASDRRETVSRISTRIPTHVRASIEEAAAWRGVSVSSFIAEAAANEAAHVLVQERKIQLAREDAERILVLLESPPPVNAALQNAAMQHKRLICG